MTTMMMMVLIVASKMSLFFTTTTHRSVTEKDTMCASREKEIAKATATMMAKNAESIKMKINLCYGPAREHHSTLVHRGEMPMYVVFGVDGRTTGMMMREERTDGRTRTVKQKKVYIWHARSFGKCYDGDNPYILCKYCTWMAVVGWYMAEKVACGLGWMAFYYYILRGRRHCQ